MAELGDFLRHAVRLDSRSRRSLQSKAKHASRRAGNDSTICIYFATQSGTARNFACDLAIDVTRQGYSSKVVDLKDFSPEVFRRHRCIILLVATYGNGEPPTNAQCFGHWLDDIKKPRETLNGVHFSVFGFGSQDYVDFNAFARHCDAGMAWFGAKRMCKRGEADAADGSSTSSFQTWKKESLLPALESTLGLRCMLPTLLQPMETVAKACVDSSISNGSCRINKIKECSGDLSASPLTNVQQSNARHECLQWFQSAVQVPVVRVIELRQQANDSTGEHTKHIELRVDPTMLMWKTAGTLEVMPKNSTNDVSWFLARLSASKDIEIPAMVPQDFGGKPGTLTDVLALQCDLTGQLKREVVQAFAALAQDQLERKTVESLLSDASTFQWLSTDVCLNLQELLLLFLPSASIDVAVFLKICPTQEPRSYTIASSCLEDPSHIGICVSTLQRTLPSASAVVEGLTQRGIKAAGADEFLASYSLTRQRCLHGLCSSHLSNITGEGNSLWIKVRPSAFCLPKELPTPMIMVAAGAGVAPFRGFLREVMAEGCLRQDTALFVGFRGEHRDFLYKSEMEEAVHKEPHALGNLSVAFSRDAGQQQYVQDVLQSSASTIKSMFGNGGIIYVCGNSKMGRAVREMVATILEVEDMKLLVQDGRYVEELW